MENLICVKNHVLGKEKPLVCVPIMDTKKDAIIQTAKQLIESGVEMIEWRVDAFDLVHDLNAIREVLTELEPIMKKTIFVYTFRSKMQGGLLELGPEEIVDLHQVAAESGVVDFIDLEYFESEHPDKEIRSLHQNGVYIIASHHDFEETPKQEVMHMLLEQMRESGADVVKLAVMPKNEDDVLALMQETSHFHQDYPDKPVITMSMGKLGGISRLAGETFGSCVSFGAGTIASAPGQFPNDRLNQMLEWIHKSME